MDEGTMTLRNQITRRKKSGAYVYPLVASAKAGHLAPVKEIAQMSQEVAIESRRRDALNQDAHMPIAAIKLACIKLEKLGRCTRNDFTTS